LVVSIFLYSAPPMLGGVRVVGSLPYERARVAKKEMNAKNIAEKEKKKRPPLRCGRCSQPVNDLLVGGDL
jgi:hypothetical protein